MRSLFKGQMLALEIPADIHQFHRVQRAVDYAHIKELYDLGNTMAKAASMMTSTTVTRRLVGSAWPPHFNKVVAEVQQKNIEAVGMPKWSDADQALAKALQNEIGAAVDGLKEKVSEAHASRSGARRGRLGRYWRYLLACKV